MEQLKRIGSLENPENFTKLTINAHSPCNYITIRYGINTGQCLIQPEIEITQIETGQKLYSEKLLKKEFIISAPSFFQLNTHQAERLVQVVLSYINSEDKTIIDAYAGVGTFTVFLAERAPRVIAIEESRSAFKDVKINIREL